MVRHSENNLDHEKLLCASLIEERADNSNSSTQHYGEHNHFDDALFDQKLELAAEGIEPYFLDHLKTRLSKENALTISQYILSMKVEINLSSNHRRAVITSLKLLSEFFENKKSFRDMKQEDILHYLDSCCRKPESADAHHKWITTYNHRLVCFIRFFKWLYFPDIEPSKRHKPSVVQNIPALKRKEKSAYKPSDLWTTEDNIIYLKYCTNKRDKCFHALAIETSCRPHELLSLKIKDIVFKHADQKQYAEILVNGKTGTRVIPLFSSLPYVKDWVLDHPQSANHNAILICGLAKNMGRKMTRYAIYDIYQHYKEKVFPTLLTDPNIPFDEKSKIQKLLNKPWNPYIHRHSALTMKAQILKEHTLRQHAGWTTNSMMPQIYLHFYGNESSKSLLEAYGLVAEDSDRFDLMRPKQCPNCNEPNKPDSKFCAQCRMVLTYDAYNETIEEKQSKDKEVENLKNQMLSMQEAQREILDLLKDPAKLLQILK